jgi:hypothetical protein
VHNSIQMRILGRLALVSLLLVAAGACKHNKKANTTVRARASFEFPCPKDELTLRVGDTQGARKLASMIGAYGCGKKAVYVYAPDIDTWVIDGAISEMPDDFEVPANVTKGKEKKRVDKQSSKAEKRGKMGPSENAAPEPEVVPDPEAVPAPE